MLQMLTAKREKVVFVADASNRMQELRTDALPDEVRILLDLLHSLGLRNLGVADRLIERPDIGQHLPPRRISDRRPGEMLPDLGKNPGIADGSASDHDAPGSRLGENSCRNAGRRDISIGQDRGG